MKTEITIKEQQFVRFDEVQKREREAHTEGHSEGYVEGLDYGREIAEEELADMALGEVLEGRLERHDALAIAGALEQSRHLFSDVRQHALTQVIDALYEV